ncbi:hypothetical protein PHET_01961 [Paragonimus heterotremus]|uniref:Uncharacterized protein n=1 Tax=Paragonimus heterotremus TaxID=100268 RepID=A0A8J4TG27_9TREM|nr:hypothetical protein PHET_01961 [Paragonimus heterotremus]
MTPEQDRLHVPATSSTIRTIETSVVDNSMPPPVRTRNVMQKQMVRTEQKNINKPPYGRNTVIRTASRVFERKPSDLFQYKLNPEMGRKFVHSTPYAAHMVNDTYPTISIHVPEIKKHRITSHLVQPAQQMIFREKEPPPRPHSMSRIQYVADNVRTPHYISSRSPYCDDAVIALSVLPGEAISRCRKVSSVDVLHEAGQISLGSFVGLDVCHNYSEREEPFAWNGLCFDGLPLCSTQQNPDYVSPSLNNYSDTCFVDGEMVVASNIVLEDVPEPFGGRGPRSLHRRLTDPLPLFPCFRPTMDICPHHNEYQLLASPTLRPHNSLMMTTYQADYTDAQWEKFTSKPGANCYHGSRLFPSNYGQAATNLTTTIKSVSPPATVRYLYQPLYASGTPQTRKEARCTHVYKAIGPQLCYPASSTGRNASDQMIQDSAILTENRRSDFLSNLPTAQVDRFDFKLCPKPYGWTVGQFSSNLAHEVRSPEELIQWDYPSRPRASCVRQALRPPACRQFGRVMSTAGIIGRRQQPMLPCMRISEEDSNRIINMRFGNDLNTYVVSSSRTGCLPSVRQTSTGSFVVNDVLDRQCGQLVGPIQSRTMNITCSQMEQLLHHNLDTAQLARWRSQLNPPPRCQITRATCVPYMQQFRIPPPPIFMHTITSMEDPVQACVQTVRRDADSMTCVVQNSINYSPIIQASDGSFIVSVSSELANPIIGTRQDGYTGFYVPFSSIPMKEKQERLRAFKNYMATLPPVTTPTYLSKPMKRNAEIEKKYIQRSVRSHSVMQTAVSELQIVPVSSQGWVKSYSKEESTTVSTPSGHMLRKSRSTVSFISGTHSTSVDTLGDTVEYSELSTSQPKVSFHKSVVTHATENRRPRAYSSVTRESVVLASRPTNSRQVDASVCMTLSSSSNEVDEFLPHSQFTQEQTTAYTIEKRFTPISHIVKHSRSLPRSSTLKGRKVSKRISVVKSLSSESSRTTSYFDKHRKSRSVSPRKSKSKDTSRRTTRKKSSIQLSFSPSEDAEADWQFLASLRNFRSCECSAPSKNRPSRTSVMFRPGQPVPKRSRKSVAQVSVKLLCEPRVS